MSPTAAAFVRLYNPSTDSEQLLHIFRETCDPASKVEPICTVGSYLWCRPYPRLSASTCFVLDDGAGRAVGYILGTSDVQSLCDRWTTDYIPTVRGTLPNLETTGTDPSGSGAAEAVARARGLLDLLFNQPGLALNRQHAGLWEKYPGQLHINLLDSHQRQGYGRVMMDAFLDAVKTEGGKGVHLGMVASNDGAAKFYDRLGFRRYPYVLDDGTSGKVGQVGSGNEEVILLVKDIV